MHDFRTSQIEIYSLAMNIIMSEINKIIMTFVVLI